MPNILDRHALINLNVISSICQKFLKTSLELYGCQFDMEEIPPLFDNYHVRAFKQLHQAGPYPGFFNRGG